MDTINNLLFSSDWEVKNLPVAMFLSLTVTVEHLPLVCTMLTLILSSFVL